MVKMFEYSIVSMIAGYLILFLDLYITQNPILPIIIILYTFPCAVLSAVIVNNTNLYK
jgi:hypothetical protein